MLAPWWRRAAAYVLRIILPASLLSQLMGSVLFGRSSPDGATGFWLFAVSAVAAGAFSAWSTRYGQSWAHRLLRIQVCNQDSGTPVTGSGMGLREMAHIVDWAPPCIGFFWPLWDRNNQTFADKLVGTIVVTMNER